MYIYVCVCVWGGPSLQTNNMSINESSIGINSLEFCFGARCSFMVRAFIHGALGHQIDPS